METKKISVNPAFFKIGGKSRTLKKERKRSARNSGYVENKELKKKLINKIKEHRQLEKLKDKIPNNKDDDTFSQHDLTNSLNYLQGLSDKHKSKKDKRRERKRLKALERQRIQPNLQQHHDLPLNSSFTQDVFDKPIITVNTPPIVSNPFIPNAYVVENTQSIPTEQLVNMKPDPPYGILKNGRKPLFSMYNRTLKKPKSLLQPYSSSPTPSVIIDNTPKNTSDTHNNISILTNDQIFERQQKLNELRDKIAVANNNSPNSVINSSNLRPGKTLKKVKQLKTTTKRYIYLGKKNGQVGVLIKNQQTRRKVLKDTNTLKKRPLSKIKKYLRKHNLIKIGSNAPEHIVRSIYENSFLAGDVYNKNVDMLLSNYLDA